MLGTGALFRAREWDPYSSIPHTTHMNTASFKSVMEEVMIPYYNSLSGHYIFQQDGATYHTARSVLSFLEDQGVGS